ncbi:hypothetical protein ACIHIX_37630 [Streptomyces sp. NPDC051913]|uniref:hypothetical protein n=1 Tax=Streptomyces sp. NPDC051913 TaxID=3365676 RepID=UPI00183D33AD|nr:hypothetical protein [Streptomyces sp.]NUS27221.1 hypothetical protein [Streptomyces sp.]
MGGDTGERPTRPCEWCGVPVEQPRGRWRRRKFCSKAHRRRNRVMDAVFEFLDFW